MGRNLIVLGYVSCNVVKHIIKLYEFIRTQVEKHLLPSFAIVQLDFVQIFVWLESHLNFTLSLDEIDEIIAYHCHDCPLGWYKDPKRISKIYVALKHMSRRPSLQSSPWALWIWSCNGARGNS